MDYHVQRCTRQCATTERKLEPGETFYSVLNVDGADVTRLDYSADAWEGPPEGALGWWKSEMPKPDARKARLAPNDVMLELFDELAEQAERQDMRYVLALLLVRRRVMRIEESRHDEKGRDELVVYCPRREATYEVAAIDPEPARVDAIQEELATLLFADAA